MVSVIIITYNHENYIGKSIDSVIKQQINAPLEIIIGDDGSTDNTTKIISDYSKKYPDIIRPVLKKHNKGPNLNYMNCYGRCIGKYIAVCEGDDYWTDPLKLQKQVDFLEQHTEYVLCYTDIRHFRQYEKKYIELIQSEIDTISMDDLFVKNYVTTLTCVFRNKVLEIPETFKYLSVGDWPLYVLLAQYGKIKRLPFISGDYRIHDNNYYQANSYLTKKIKMTKATEFLYEHLNSEHKYLAKNKLLSSYYILATNFIKNSNKEEAYMYYEKMKNLPGVKHSKEYILHKAKLLMFKYLSLT